MAFSFDRPSGLRRWRPWGISIRAMDDSSAPYWKRLNQEGIVLAIAVVLFIAASVGLPGFFASDNLVSIVRSVSVLGILALGMAIVIIGRGIDLSAVAIMA